MPVWGTSRPFLILSKTIDNASSKAADEVNKEKKSLMRQKNERHFAKKRGRFDARMITSEEDPHGSQEEMTDEIEPLRKQRKGAEIGKRKRSPHNNYPYARLLY